MSARAQNDVLVRRHVLMLRGQLLGALAIGWALGCAGRAEGSDPQEAEEREANRAPSPPPGGCPSGDAEVECYPLLVLETIVTGREASGQTEPVEYTDEGCAGPNVAISASLAYACGPSPAGEPVRRGDTCCYHHCNASPGCGRPFVVAGEARVASAGASLDWLRDARSPAAAPGSSPDIAGEWLRDALAEHASVASFSAFNLSLLALGAPAALVQASATAALDEVFHATACFELARRYGGGALGPAPLGMDQLRVDTDLATVAARTFVDGCLGETAAALVARASLDLCDDPLVRSVLERIARDEAKHAELAWQFVAWALRRGGDDVACALSLALDHALASVAATACRAPAPAPAGWHRAGRLSMSEQARLTEQAFREIVQPTLSALLSRHPRPALTGSPRAERSSVLGTPA
jgi:hypothetical protein